MLTHIWEVERASVLCLQEVHADFPTLLANQPCVYDGPPGSRGRDAGLLIHEGVAHQSVELQILCLSSGVLSEAKSVLALSKRLMQAFLRVIASRIGEKCAFLP